MKIGDKWYSSEGLYHGEKVIVQCRRNLKFFFDTGLYNDLIEITWNYLCDTSDDNALEDEILLIAKVDDALEHEFEMDNQSILVTVIIFNKSKHFYWYTKSLEEFERRLNDSLQNFDKDKVPLEFGSLKDPEWKQYYTMLNGAQNLLR